MNVVDAIWTAVLLGVIGGAVHGIMTYHGLVFPKTIEADVPINPDDKDSKTYKVDMWVLGVVGEAIIGGLAAVILLFSVMRPEVVFSRAADAMLENPLKLTDLAALILVGLAGSVFIQQQVEKRGWNKVIAQTIEGTKSQDGANTQAQDDEPVTTLRGVIDTSSLGIPEGKPTIVIASQTPATPAPTQTAVSTAFVQRASGMRPWQYIKAAAPRR